MRELTTDRWFTAIAALSFALALAGCGGGDRVPPAETAVTEEAEAAFDPCSFLSSEELVEIVGNPLLAGSTANEPGQCHWNSQAPEDVSVVLSVQPAGAPGAAEPCAEVATSASEEFEAESWQFQALPVGAIAVLEVCDGGNWLSVTLAGDRGDDDLRSAATARGRE
jgi:hypothetical protein